jgi:hypothetical protein
MLVMVRWNIELPRLMPLVVESLKEQEAKQQEATAAAAGGAGRTNSVQDISNQIVVVEDRPGLSIGSNNQMTIYPVLVMVKNSPFTNSEHDLIKARVARNDAKVIAMPGGYIQPPYDKLLSVSGGNNSNNQKQQSSSQVRYDPQQTTSIFGLKPPTDDSPFYFAKEQIPSQMKALLETVAGVSVVLSLLLLVYSRKQGILLTTSASRKFHILFVISIGLGFMFLEITFIQKFLLLLGTPIMALTVILFSILLSSGIGAYLSGRLFKNPYKAVVISIPLLALIVLIYYNFLSSVIDSSVVLQLYQRILLTFAILSPAGLLMGFQFPSITRMASSTSIQAISPLRLDSLRLDYRSTTATNDDVTLLWGVNIIASVIGTVLTAILSMIIGFNGNLLVGLGLYLAALISAIMAAIIPQKVLHRNQTIAR